MKKSLFLLPFFLWTCGGGGSSSPTQPEVPDLPNVQNIEITINEDESKTFALLGNEPNNLALSYTVSSNPNHGVVEINNLTATYVPNANYNGTDTFNYVASSTNGTSNIGVVIITINPVNDEPNSKDIQAITDEDNSVDITLNAEEYDGDQIVFQIKNNPSNGNIEINENIVTYTPNQNWNGTDQFNFEAVDSTTRSSLNVATATIIVNPIDDAPEAQNSSINTNEDQNISFSLSYSDPDSQNLTLSIIESVVNGTCSWNENTCNYQPSSNWFGVDSLKFEVSDGTLVSNIAKVTINVESVNDAPVIENVSGEADEDNNLEINLSATDVENDNITFNIVQQTNNGSISISDSKVSYIPNENWFGTDTFTYQANDQSLGSNIATGTITINSVNDAPTSNSLNDFNLFTDIDKSLTISIDSNNIFWNDVDTDIESLDFEIVSNTTNGDFTFSEDGSGNNFFQYSPNTGFVGLDSLEFKIYDGELYSNTSKIHFYTNVLKMDTSGSQWQTNGFQTSNMEYIYGGWSSLLKVDNQGNVTNILSDLNSNTGFIYSIGEFSNNNGFILSTSTGIKKISSNGAELWKRNVYNSENIIVDSNDDVIHIKPGSGDNLIKYDENGNFLWSKNSNPNTSHTGLWHEADAPISQLSDGGYIIGCTDGVIEKTDINGNYVWEYVYDISMSTDMIYNDIVEDSQGHIVAVGFNRSSNEGFIINVDSQGNHLSYDIIQDNSGINQGIVTSTVNPFSVKSTSDGGFIVGATSNYRSSTCSTCRDNQLSALIKLNSNLNVEWEKHFRIGHIESKFNATNENWGLNAFEDNDGDFVLIGTGRKPITGSNDMGYILKISEDGPSSTFE